MRRLPIPSGEDAQTPGPADVVRLLPAERFPNIHALASHIYGGGGAFAGDARQRCRQDPAMARFDFGLGEPSRWPWRSVGATRRGRVG